MYYYFQIILALALLMMSKDFSNDDAFCNRQYFEHELMDEEVERRSIFTIRFPVTATHLWLLHDGPHTGSYTIYEYISCCFCPNASLFFFCWYQLFAGIHLVFLIPPISMIKNIWGIWI